MTRANGETLRDQGDPMAILAGLDAIIDEAVDLTADVDRSTVNPRVGQALDLMVGAQEAVAALMVAWEVYDPDDPSNNNEEDSEQNMLEANLGLPYMIMFDYRSDGGPMMIGTFPSRDAANQHMLMTARPGFEAEWSVVPISKPDY